MFNVTVTANHPENGRCENTLSCPDDYTLEQMSALTLQALDAVQYQLGLPSSQAELIASRGMLQSLTDILDELAVDAGPYEGMLAVVWRVSALGDEVRRLRADADGGREALQRQVDEVSAERDRLRTRLSRLGRVVTETRRRLDMFEGTYDTEIPRIVGGLVTERNRLRRENEGMVETIREVRDAVGAGPDTRVCDLASIVRSWRMTDERETRLELSIADTPVQRWQQALNRVRLDAGLPMVPVEQVGDASEFDQVRALIGELRLNSKKSSATPEQLARTLFEVSREVSATRGSEPMPIIEKSAWEGVHPNRRRWWLDVARRTLDDVGVNVPTSLLPVTPERLARAMHAGRSVMTLSGGLRPPLWMPMPWEELDAPAREWFERVAEVALSELPQIVRVDAESDASFAAHMDAITSELRQRIGILDRANGELEEQRTRALDSFREIASVLGMSFGLADDMRALGETTATAVRQLKQERDLLGRSQYRGMLMFVADQLGLSAEVIDDPKAFGEAFRAALAKRVGKARAFSFCAPAPEDWVIELRPVGPLPGDSEGDVSGWFRDGAKLAMEDGLFTARLRYTGDLRQRPEGTLLVPSVTAEQLAKAWLEIPTQASPGFPWDEFTVLHETYIEHARRVIERLSLEGLARQGRKQAVALPGEAFAFGPDGTPLKMRSDFLAPQRFKGFRAGVPELDREALRAALGKVASDVDAEAVARSIQSLSGGRIQASAGVDRAALLEQVKELGAELSRTAAELGRERERAAVAAEKLARHGEFEWKLATVLGVVPAREVVRGRVSELVAFEREHRVCKGAELLERELTGQLAEALGLDERTPQGNPWPWVHLMSRVGELSLDRQNVHNLQRQHCEDLREALGVKSVGWVELMVDVRGRSAVVSETRRMVSEREEDLSRALGLNSGESWEDMIEIVTGRTSRAEADRMAVNALAEIGRILDLPERAFPALVVSSVRELHGSWGTVNGQLWRLIEACGAERGTLRDEDVVDVTSWAVKKVGELRDFRETAVAPFRSGDLGRMSDAVIALVEAAGIAVDGTMAHDVVVDKASDAAAVLRSWPDVVRAVGAFDGDEVEQPDEVAPLLRVFAEVYFKADRRGSVTRAIERLLAAHRGEPLRDNLDTMYERLDTLVNNLYEPLREIAGHYGVKAADYVDKQRFAEHVLMVARNHVAVSSLSPVAVAEQVAARLESWATLRADADDPDFVQSSQFPEVLHKATLRHAASTVRGYTAALASGGHSHPLVTALEFRTPWVPSVFESPDGMALQLKATADGESLVVSRESSDVMRQAVTLYRPEWAAVGTGLLMLNLHHARTQAAQWGAETDLGRAVEAAEQQETVVTESAPERDAAADEPDQDTES